MNELRVGQRPLKPIRHRPAGFGASVDPEGDTLLTSAAQQLVDVTTGEREGFDIPLRPAGSERARQVWDLVAAVPRGSTSTWRRPSSR